MPDDNDEHMKTPGVEKQTRRFCPDLIGALRTTRYDNIVGVSWMSRGVHVVKHVVLSCFSREELL